MPEAVIVATARSPIGRAHKGSLREMRLDDLALQMVQTVLGKVPQLDPHTIDDLILGSGEPAGEAGYNLARVVAVLAGLDDVPGMTVNRYCSSSLQTTRMAFHAIKAGEGDVFLSVGVETVSRFPRGAADDMPGTKNEALRSARERTEARAPRAAPRPGRIPARAASCRMSTSRWDRPPRTWRSSRASLREEQDRFAVQSQNRTERAIAAGFYAREIDPVTLPDGTVVAVDDGPRPGTTIEAVRTLQPVFRPDGTVTAGNACPLNDGAAALVIMSDSRARELGLTPLARIVATGVSGLSPEIMGLGPIEATRRALARARMQVDDVDLFEINEAFAVQVLGSAREIGIDEDRLNVSGGAIALGHPFGMTGARITTTLLNNLRTHDKQFGLETMCVGGGQGMAMILERLA